MYRLDEPVKVERYILLTRDAGTITIRPSSSVYLLLPSDIYKRLKNGFNLDLKEKNLEKFCSLVSESEEDGKRHVRIIYDIWKESDATKLEAEKNES